ncbi:MAG: hypothetical protein A2754_00185 [Candidatus Magasanikbacteria bacterium RIFCSPHIGHO2_01_FULL_47_8]|uniref:Diacylglycerol kinase n=1 Tax=Candidatus Magasanikbacteria bacterium RIFCSPHIGHO2_01_FULL_47_8 TaxID=1798673 RepID=A0A1F6MC94_9BACT|nr:MAG: hypothetical protein A2754_00185 [Candidatus Magasanikbacteria bacterium RIFCSPHIGHO2_01_FULL_47_8]
MSAQRLHQSFIDAWHGLKYVFNTEQNFRIQVIASLFALGASIYFPLHAWEVVLIILLIVMVLTMELLNTALEKFSDLLKPRLHHYVGVIKDIMAGAVLLTSLAALLVGLIIFLPHFIGLFK